MKVAAITFAFACALLAAGSSCSDGAPDMSTSGGMGTSGGTDRCATPQEGCTCTPGAVVPCGNEIKADDNFIYCYEGFRTCSAAGVYGTCAEGSVTTKAKRTGDLSTQALGMPGACTTADACDPYCQVVTDDGTGLTIPGFVGLDGGISPGAPGQICGNSIVGGTEQCDDGNTNNNDGCSSTCQLEPGFQCPTPGMPCIPSTCGNGIVEGLEQCDDGNIRPYDGCSPTCTKDFNCPAGMPCTAVCGDGLKMPGEACDDGNLTDGDGCSSTCTVEMGAMCNTVTAPAPSYIDLPILYRDFTPTTHPDFEFVGGGLPHPPYGPPFCSGYNQGIPDLDLAADKEPTFLATHNCTAGATFFNQWYRDTPGVNQVILGHYLRLKQSGASYVFDSAGDPAYNNPNINCGNALGPGTTCNGSYGGFFPINNLGYGNYAATGKNYHFTSEVRYPFTYQGGEVLNFTGDDDVFVYIAGKKVVDIGGFHGPQAGNVTLNASTQTVPVATPLNLVVGQTYEIDVFQVERHVTGSNYKLTITGFNRQISSCTPPPSPTVFTRDFQATCDPGFVPVWQLFQWKAGVPPTATIDFRAATAATQAALPASPPGPSPTTVPIGSATNLNSPILALPLGFQNDINSGPPATPRPVSQDLAAVGQQSQQWLRVYMTFNGPPSILYAWQQLYDCVPME